MAPSIRVAQLSDARRIAELTTQLGYEADVSTVEMRLSRILVRPDQQFLVAELDGLAVGWVHAALAEFVESGVFVVIGGLVVDRSHRGKGIGRTLMTHAEERAEKQGCSIVRLWSSSSRTDAHRFYENLGYRNIKTQYGFIKSVGTPGEETPELFVPRIE
jgi:GNAT superfamily N-acetyltransferase